MSEQPESLAKGHAFEDYIADHFRPTEYRLQTARADRRFGASHIAKDDSKPDLVWRCLKSKTLFAVECKWRNHWKPAGIDFEIQWAQEYQPRNYRRFLQDEGMPVFVALGVGGTAGAPAEVFVIPIGALNEHVVLKSEIERFKSQHADGYFALERTGREYSLRQTSTRLPATLPTRPAASAPKPATTPARHAVALAAPPGMRVPSPIPRPAQRSEHAAPPLPPLTFPPREKAAAPSPTPPPPAATKSRAAPLAFAAIAVLALFVWQSSQSSEPSWMPPGTESPPSKTAVAISPAVAPTEVTAGHGAVAAKPRPSRIEYQPPTRLFQLAIEATSIADRDAVDIALDQGRRAATLFAPDRRPPFLAIPTRAHSDHRELAHYLVYDTETNTLLSQEILVLASKQPARTVARLRGYECFFVTSSWLEHVSTD